MGTIIVKHRTSITCNESYKGETIEQKVARITNNKEPIKDGAPLVYTDRKDGVQPAYDIRTDRFDIAIDAMDKVAQQKIANRAKVINIKDDKEKEQKIDTKDNSGTEANNATNGNKS